MWNFLRSGRKVTLKQGDIKFIEELLEKDKRTYNSQQLSKILKKQNKLNQLPEESVESL